MFLVWHPVLTFMLRHVQVAMIEEKLDAMKL